MKNVHQLSWKLGGFSIFVLALILFTTSDSYTQSGLPYRAVTLLPPPAAKQLTEASPVVPDEAGKVSDANEPAPSPLRAAPEKTVVQEREAGQTDQGQLAQLETPSATTEARFKPYAINLASTIGPIDPSRIPDLELPEGLHFYASGFEKGGMAWNRLRLGFFASRKAAKKLLRILDQHFPGAWITKVTRQEWELSGRQAITPSSPEIVALPPPSTLGEEPPPKLEPPIPEKKPPGKPTPPLGRQKVGDVMTEARAAMTRGDLQQAIQLFTKLLRSPDEEFHRDAKELLGLARERNDQFAHAKAEYEEYLTLYPEGEGTARVKQRLAGLLTARSKPKAKLGQEGDQLAEESEWAVGATGSFAQFYRRDESFDDIEGRTLNISELNSDLDLIATARSDWLDTTFRATGGYVADFLKDGDSESRIAALYGEVLDPRHEIFGRVGRQNRSTDGVLGRFDGGFLSYQVLPEVQLNAVGGFPVDRTTDLEINDDRYFAGVSTDLGTFFDSLDLNVYFINQFVDGITDRRAVGAETRYFDTNRSAFLLLDYDVSYSALNLAVFGGTWIFPDQTTVSLSLDYRKSPILTTTSALQGQTAASISELLDDFSENEIRDLAEDRTADSRTVTVGASRPLNDTFQISSDFTLSNLSSTDSSGGIEGSPSTGNEYFFSLQLIGTGLITERDIETFGFRYADTSNSDRFTFDINTRYPVTNDFRVSPRLQTNYRINEDDDGTQFSIRPSVRLTYFWKRILQPELEIGGEWRKDRRDGVSDETFDFFVDAGYRLDF